ncbi:MAG: indoleamine 2,3-dioxygenase [Gemmatimonadaceae bacterium]|jgi:indoleamine 2,3-dioxygenase|nr:indoleamine 2,3-dioxygenase [Gemmatimonadaceae bacterium]
MALTLPSPVDLAHYWVDPVTGFVPGTPPLKRLPSTFDAWEVLLPEFPALLRARRLRAALRALPPIPAEAAVTDGEQERALLVLCHFANAWVWGGEEPDLVLPRAIAVPLVALATTLERQPIAHYASMTLRNWQLVDPALPLSADNARTQVQFLGGIDEDWFFVSSMGVELAGAPLLPLVASIDRASHEGDDATLADLVGRFVEGMPAVLAALERVREWCDPHIFYRRVRPFVTGWPKPGVIYEGVWDEPRRFIGGSAAQSSLLQLFDAVLGVAHPDTPSGAYLRMVRDYMPRPHRAFVEDVERSSRLRARAAGGTLAVREAYNAALDMMQRFRDAHMGLAHDFILRPAGPVSDPKGTGGTALTTFLRGAHDTTAESKL